VSQRPCLCGPPDTAGSADRCRAQSGRYIQAGVGTAALAAVEVGKNAASPVRADGIATSTRRRAMTMATGLTGTSTAASSIEERSG
jgi:hypothetical protein